MSSPTPDAPTGATPPNTASASSAPADPHALTLENVERTLDELRPT